MSVNNTINDSSLLYGSLEITLSTGSMATYETNDLKFDQEIERFVRKSSIGLADGKVVIQSGDMTGTFTAEYPTATTVAPVFGDAFSITLNGIAYNCHIEKVGIARTMNGLAKIPCTFAVDIGTVVVSAKTVV